jgi:hypothetical protein
LEEDFALVKLIAQAVVDREDREHIFMNIVKLFEDKGKMSELIKHSIFDEIDESSNYNHNNFVELIFISQNQKVHSSLKLHSQQKFWTCTSDS